MLKSWSCVCAFDTDIIEGIPHDTGLLQYIMHMLATEDIEGLPPGGGINAKYVSLQHAFLCKVYSICVDTTHQRPSE